MNKLSILLCSLFFAAANLSAQNLQLHYDFGSTIYSDEEGDRQKATLTIEQFKADDLGSWYYFVDLDATRQGMTGAYTEISREFNLGKQSPFAAHIELDGGVTVGKDNSYGARFQPAALVGGVYNGHNADFSTTYSLQLLYKQFFHGAGGEKAYSSAQLTGVWSTRFAQDKITFAGFIDFWRGEKANGHGQLVILSEPQLWYNINKNISVGTEVELSNNFIFPNCQTDKTFYVNPTLAVKLNL